MVPAIHHGEIFEISSILKSDVSESPFVDDVTDSDCVPSNKPVPKSVLNVVEKLGRTHPKNLRPT